MAVPGSVTLALATASRFAHLTILGRGMRGTHGDEKARKLLAFERPRTIDSKFKTGETISESGIYAVTHAGHRLPHRVTLLRGEEFPKCAACKEGVEFQLLAWAPSLNDTEGLVKLYSIPTVEEPEEPGSMGS